MTNYQQAKFYKRYYFFTVFTYKRKAFLTDVLSRICLNSAWRSVCLNRPFETVAFCILPDHLHCLWRLPRGDSDFSNRWLIIKKRFTQQYRIASGYKFERRFPRERNREHSMWQKQFWKYKIKDKKDLLKHIDYIHYNPVKHGLVNTVKDWQWSTYQKFVSDGFYKRRALKDYDGNFGEDLPIE